MVRILTEESLNLKIVWRKEGAQQALFPYNDPGQLPITPLRQANGEWLRIQLDLPGHPIWLRAWQIQVGRVKLYLLDSNDSANFPPYRGITSELYGGGPDLRLVTPEFYTRGAQGIPGAWVARMGESMAERRRSGLMEEL